MADQTKDPNTEKKPAPQKPAKREKAPAPPPVRTVARAQATGSLPTAEAGKAVASPTAEPGKRPAPSTGALDGRRAPSTPAADAPDNRKTQQVPVASVQAKKQASAVPQPAKAAPKPEKRKAKADSEQVRLKKEEQVRRSRRRNRQFIGLAVAILVVVGAVSIVMGSIQMAQSLFDTSSEIEEYQNRFKAFVWFDVLPFDSISMVDENSLKQVIIWSIFDDMGEELTRNDQGEAQVPASDVDRYGAEIFGPDFRFSGHSGFRDPVFDLTYQFDESTQMYIVPATSLNNNYLPQVVEVIREPGGVRRVVMGYVSTTNSENQVVASPDFEHPVRYMDYMLRRDGSGYYLYAIQNNTTHEVTTAATFSGTSAPEDASLPELRLEDPLLADGPAITSEPFDASEPDDSGDDESADSSDSAA